MRFARATRHPGVRTPTARDDVVELTGGRLMLLRGTDQGSRYRSYPADGGDPRAAAGPSDIKSPLSPASVRRAPTTGHLLLV